MKKVTIWLHLAVLNVMLILMLCDTSLSGTLAQKKLAPQRADMIIIDEMAVFGKLDKPPVVFLHDVHTDALAEQNQSKERLVCATCHITDGGKLTPKFKRTENLNKKTVMNIYHDECISCHGEMKKDNKKTGPIDCGECHTLKSAYRPSRADVGFDNSLHYRHSKAAQEKCETCHHAYDEEKKELYYAKGEEGTCRYCHEKQTVDNRVSMPIASHTACLGCHINIQTTPDISPPVTCDACHNPVEQKKIKVIESIPRMKRNQPDMVLLKADDKTIAENLKAGRTNQMNFVPFNHLAHETANNTCRVCHHDSLKACNTCHIPGGTALEPLDAEPGKKIISLEMAMHKINSDQSCIGCHNKAKKKPSCAGCHGFISNEKKMTDAQCMACHSVNLKMNTMPLERTKEAGIAKTALDSRKRVNQTFSDEDIPEMVTIKRLENLYEPVQFPHRKVVNAIVARVADNNLSGFFHTSEATLCQGCHHNSPASKKPPQCASCHEARWNDTQLSKPGILGAYHQQCMGCHKEMKVEKPMGCNECHKLKAK